MIITKASLVYNQLIKLVRTHKITSGEGVLTDNVFYFLVDNVFHRVQSLREGLSQLHAGSIKDNPSLHN